jgi:hypothetical protein
MVEDEEDEDAEEEEAAAAEAAADAGGRSSSSSLSLSSRMRATRRLVQRRAISWEERHIVRYSRFTHRIHRDRQNREIYRLSALRLRIATSLNGHTHETQAHTTL